MGNHNLKPKNEAAQLFIDRLRTHYDIKGDNSSLPKPDSSFKALVSALCAIPKDEENAVISICKKPINDQLVQAITKCLVRNRAIQGLLFSKCDMKDDAISSLLKLIESNVRIVYFDLSQLSLTSDQVVKYCQALKANEFIQSVGMVGLGMTDANAPTIIDLLKLNRTLKVIDLSDNAFSLSTIEQLIDVVKENTSITKLTLKGYSIPSSLQKKLDFLLERNTAVSDILDLLLANSCKRNFSTRLSAFRRSVFLRRGEEDPGTPETTDDGTEPAYKFYRSSTASVDRLVNTPSVRFLAASGESKGRRHEMQDVSFLNGKFRNSENEDFYAIFDGHGGREPAAYCAKHLHGLFNTELSKYTDLNSENIVSSLKSTFIECNKRMSAFSTMQGTTATCLYISADKKLYLAHVGDTRAVLCTRSSNPPKQATSLASELEASYKEAGVVQITKDHTLQDVQERQAVVGRGATIANERVNGTLQITRALGDSNLSNYISCIPDIFEHTLTPDDEFLIIACDGIWDVLTPVQAVEHVKSAVKQGAPKDVAQSLVTCAFDKNSGDNLSAIVVFFQPQELSK